MKAYIYRDSANNNFICSKFDNSTERVTIYHDNKNIFHQYWQPGEVKYENQIGQLSNTVPQDAVLSVNNVGDIVSHVWRPGLCLDISKALKIDEGEKLRAKRELKILIEKLHEILMYIEPDNVCLNTYGHKIRELLILACTECENTWTYYMRLSANNNSRLTTNDYVKLKDKLFLDEYQVTFSNHPIIKYFKPFDSWNVNQPTSSLPWYDDYNKTKHNKDRYFNKATLENCLNAISANIIMFCIKYSPYELINSNDICSSLINEYFSIELINPKIETFYIPYLKSVPMSTGALVRHKASAFEQDWNIIPFVI